MQLTMTDLLRFVLLLDRNVDGSFLSHDEAAELIHMAGAYLRLVEKKEEANA